MRFTTCSRLPLLLSLSKQRIVKQHCPLMNGQRKNPPHICSCGVLRINRELQWMTSSILPARPIKIVANSLAEAIRFLAIPLALAATIKPKR